MADRRDALKIIGAIGTTCAFPFASDELYGQHVHPPAGKQAETGPPKFFTPGEFQMIRRIAELIIPATGTPGAIEAGVPGYIDTVVSANAPHQTVFRAGLEALGAGFLALSEEQQIATLTPLCEAADKGTMKTPAERFFKAMKSMTADGYYTSRIGLVEELGYKGNTVLAEFPSCEVPEH
ncbi:MAG TPA: gluconate 2-dehydrogenase subunit 3 family protein [Bryobacteraceae bacterium]|nr:gluconate 2-dehydrogenase subunit 3 family protein [Bryobacteraceae bacterium]